MGKITSADAIQAYLTQLGYPISPARLVENEAQRPSTLCYIVDRGRLLMLRRKKEPFANHWTAPGGKIVEGETPPQAIVREVFEETGLTIANPTLKAVCSEVGEANYNWLLFLFRAESFYGEVTEGDEGELRWISLDLIDDFLLPEIDRKIMPYILGDAPHPYWMRIEYASDHSVARFQKRSLHELL